MFVAYTRNMISEGLLKAATDLRWLLDRGYPKDASVKLVGDRHRLDKTGRQMLYRGVASSSDAARRRALLISPAELAARHLVVDGHNVVLTVANALAGISVFESDDGLIRDIGALHGRLHHKDLMSRSLAAAAKALSKLQTSAVYLVFDEPLSHSRDHASALRSYLSDTPGNFEIDVKSSGDQAVKSAVVDIVSTADSGIIDNLDCPVFDLARFVLEEGFAWDFDSFLNEL